MYFSYVVEECGKFFQCFIAFFILLIVTKGGLYQYFTRGNNYFTTLYLYQCFTNVLRDLFMHGCILDQMKPYKNVKRIKSFPF